VPHVLTHNLRQLSGARKRRHEFETPDRRSNLVTFIVRGHYSNGNAPQRMEYMKQIINEMGKVSYKKIKELNYNSMENCSRPVKRLKTQRECIAINDTRTERISVLIFDVLGEKNYSTLFNGFFGSSTDYIMQKSSIIAC
jgi:hypothetical protein